jgi:hypothetical protein
MSQFGQQAIPVFAGGDHTMTSDSTRPCLPQSEKGWFVREVTTVTKMRF